MNKRKSPWSNPDLHRPDKSADPSSVEPRDQQMRPTHEQGNSPGSSKRQRPNEPYRDPSED